MITGKKIILDIPQEHHLEKMLEWRNTPEFRKYFREYRVLSKEHQHKWWREKVISDDTWQYFVIKPQSEPDKIIGVTGLLYLHPVYKTGEFAINIGDPDFREGGYGSDALRTLTKYGFDQLNLNRIWCEVYSNNAAIDIYRHIGFIDEGLLRQTVFKDGEYLDSYILSMLRTDYEKLSWKK
jgi:UDP-4-amino-4,6-dideoxy-N-acetyl-beta-L-altrosamine N-acetyltransferase